MLTASELTAMRAVVNTSLAGTAIIERGTLTSDSGGGYTEGWSSAGTVSCRIAPLGGMEDVTGSRISADADWMLTVPFDTSITENDRVVSAGGTFTVRAVRTPRTFELSRRAEVERIV